MGSNNKAIINTIVKRWLMAVVAFVFIFPVNVFGFKIGNFWRAFAEATGYYGAGVGPLTVNGVTNGPTNPLVVNNTATYLTAAAAVGATSVTVNSIAGFANGNKIVIIQMYDNANPSTAGYMDFVTVNGAPAGVTINVTPALTRSYKTYAAGTSAAQVVKADEYTNITVNSGAYITTPAWNGATGGVMYLLATADINIIHGGGTAPGTISVGYTNAAVAVGAKGYRGGGITTAGQGPGGSTAGGAAGGANAVGGNANSPGTPYYLVMGSGGGGSTTHTGGHGGGIIILKTQTNILLDGVISADGGPASGATGGKGGAGAIYIAADQFTKTTTCGAVKSSAGTVGTAGTLSSDGRSFILYKNVAALGCPAAATPAANATYQRFYVK